LKNFHPALLLAMERKAGFLMSGYQPVMATNAPVLLAMHNMSEFSQNLSHLIKNPVKTHA